MRLLIAFDKFKDTLSAPRACELVRAELIRLAPEAFVETAPISDGGDGFCEVLTRSANGVMETVSVSGPLGKPVPAKLGFIDGAQLSPETWIALRLKPCRRLAVVEMAQASGLHWLTPAERNPWVTTSGGTGELLLAAARGGAEAIVLGIGGSATNDCGLGALATLGLECRDSNGSLIPCPTPANWNQIASLSGHSLASLPPLRIACDVENPLLGPQGASGVFGPQKGLREVAEMEATMEMLSARLCQTFQRDPAVRMWPGAGAAGGLGFGLMTAFGAEFVSGFEVVESWLALEQKLAAADLVITGEGCFDASSLGGKGPGTLVRRVQNRNGRVLVLAGRIAPEVQVTLANQVGLELIAITPPGMALAEALAHSERLLVEAVRTYWTRAA